VYAAPDAGSLHKDVADEAVLLDKPSDKGPIAPYLDIGNVIKVTAVMGSK
jgi:pyruvate carboxylase